MSQAWKPIRLSPETIQAARSMMTSEQMRAVRALIRETSPDPSAAQSRGIDAVHQALDAAGVGIIRAREGGAGVRLRRS